MRNPRPSPQIIATAAHWAATLDGDDVTDDERAACASWVAESPLHAAAWQRLQAFNDQCAKIGPIEHGALNHALGVRRKRRMRVASAGGVAILLGLAAVSILRGDALRSMFPDYRAGKGEIREIALTDGSRLTLDTDGAVNVDFDAASRRLDLVRGQVAVTVARAPGHPFIVSTPDGSATALGTRFVVRREDDATEVSVIESHVRACPADGGAAGCRILGPGERIRMTRAGTQSLSRVEPDRAALWTTGWLEVDDREVAEVLGELNRYRNRSIHFDAAALAGLRISGSYPLRDTDRALEGIAASGHLAIEHLPGGDVSVTRR